MTSGGEMFNSCTGHLGLVQRRPACSGPLLFWRSVLQDGHLLVQRVAR